MARKKSQGLCHLWWCEEEAYALDLCLRHYRAQQRGGGRVRLSADAVALLQWVDGAVLVLRQVAAGDAVDREAVQELINQL